MQTPSTITTSDDTSRQPLYAVLVLNDDDTPMEFVVHVLERFFGMDREAAMRIMLDIHTNGIAECGRYGHEEAKARVKQVLSFAQEHRQTHDQSSSSPERGFVWFEMRPDPNRSYSRCQTCAVVDLNGQTA
jgi:ATP-dependent Clp protease adaptor protein ClpS